MIVRKSHQKEEKKAVINAPAAQNGAQATLKGGSFFFFSDNLIARATTPLQLQNMN